MSLRHHPFLFGGWTSNGLRDNQLAAVADHPGAGIWPASGLVDLRDLSFLTGELQSGR